MEFNALVYYYDINEVNQDSNIEDINTNGLLIRPSVKLSIYGKKDFDYENGYDLSRLIPNISVSLGYAYKNGNQYSKILKGIDATLLLRNQFSDILQVTTNFRLTIDGNNKIYSYGQNFQLEIDKKMAMFFEYYSDLNREDFFVNTGFGAIYTPKPNLNIRLSAGSAFGKRTPSYFFNLGVSFRLGKHSNKSYKSKNPVRTSKSGKYIFK